MSTPANPAPVNANPNPSTEQNDGGQSGNFKLPLAVNQQPCLYVGGK